MKTITWILVVLLLGAGAQAQQTKVSGYVRSADDGLGIPGVNVLEKGTTNGTVTDGNGWYQLEVKPGARLVFSFVGYVTQEVAATGKSQLNIQLLADVQSLSELVVTGAAADHHHRKKSEQEHRYQPNSYAVYAPPAPEHTEEYAAITENEFHDALREPLSTFSIDVDKAAYSNVRRFINTGKLPPADAVRVEEMINYFTYQYAQPEDEHPFSIFTEVGPSPWNSSHKLVHIGLQGKKMDVRELPPSNLVFLIDVSGSMAAENKLPLVKASLKLLVEQLRATDRVAIVVYAGAAGLVLPATAGSEKRTIMAAIDHLEAGGSTAGGMGIRLAYQVALENYRPEGNNRVILATDGDFNVGESSNQAMEKLIEERRGDGVYLTVLGYGMGNYKDAKMEILADKGNGNYAYIDNLLEAQKTLVQEFGGTLFTIAKDVKLQVEFNPAKVKAYRLIGYENRMLKTEDFANDKKDAGELGSGHTVTALYEIVPAGVNSALYPDLKYQQPAPLPMLSESDEWLTVKFRYKKPDGAKSILLSKSVSKSVEKLAATSENFRWSASVAAFGLLLRQSALLVDYQYEDALQLAQGARGVDEDGYRAEMIHLIKSTRLLAMR
jgi:Ca-activated chloride channel family protein